MKKLYVLLGLVSLSAIAQNQRPVIGQIAEAEAKSAAKIMSVAVNPNTLNYDVTHHTLDLTFDLSNFTNLGGGNWQTSIQNGTVTTDFRVTQATNTITFDLTDQLDVSSVTENGNPLVFAQNIFDELVITFPSTLAVDSNHTVVITYSGIPSGSGFGSFVADKHNNTPVIWTLSEPFGARDWWPCKQDLNDKIDNGVDVYITANAQYNAVANGLQVSAETSGTQKTTHFHHGYPIPAYLVAFAVTNYQTYNQQGGLGTPESPYFPIIHYSYPENATSIQNSVSVTPDIINFYETKFGPYPFRNEKYGHCQFAWGGGMEHTTVSFMTAGNNGYSRELIAHEMGHQWFGDKVTCGSWRDIWLNEGFATYLATLVIEHFDGDDAFTEEKAAMVDYITSQPGGAVYLTETEATNVNRIFSSRLTYNKGGMVLNMLRLKLGDEAFFQGLQNYLSDPQHAYGYALTPDLQSHLEAASGLDLDEFFNDWVYMQGYPTYDIVAHNTTPGHATITVSQTQSSNTVDFFEGSVPVRLFGAGGQETDIVLDLTVNDQTFNIDVPFVITGVLFNPKSDIISADSQATLSTSNFDLNTAVTLAPNPSHDQLRLSLPGGVSVEKTVFYNTLGQVAKSSATELEWNVSDLATGVYLVKIQTSAGTTQRKFVKN